jgi:hypothetical protein
MRRQEPGENTFAQQHGCLAILLQLRMRCLHQASCTPEAASTRQNSRTQTCSSCCCARGGRSTSSEAARAQLHPAHSVRQDEVEQGSSALHEKPSIEDNAASKCGDNARRTLNATTSGCRTGSGFSQRRLRS